MLSIACERRVVQSAYILLAVLVFAALVAMAVTAYVPAVSGSVQHLYVPFHLFHQVQVVHISPELLADGNPPPQFSCGGGVGTPC